MNEIDKRTVLLSRELPFARERIWTAMTHPDHVNRWWGPDGFRNEDVVMEFRVGGLWSYTMVGPDGKVSALDIGFALNKVIFSNFKVAL